MAEPGAQMAVRFRHERIREVIVSALGPPRRRALHLTIARRLATVPEWFAVAAHQYLPVVEATEDGAVNAQLTAALRLIVVPGTATLVRLRALSQKT